MSIMALALVFLSIVAGVSAFIGTILGWALSDYLRQAITDEPRDYQS